MDFLMLAQAVDPVSFWDRIWENGPYFVLLILFGYYNERQTAAAEKRQKDMTDKFLKALDRQSQLSSEISAKQAQALERLAANVKGIELEMAKHAEIIREFADLAKERKHG